MADSAQTQFYTGEPLIVNVPQTIKTPTTYKVLDGVYTVYEVINTSKDQSAVNTLDKVFTGKVYIDPNWPEDATRSAPVDIMPIIRNRVTPVLNVSEFVHRLNILSTYVEDTKEKRIFNHIFMVAFGESNTDAEVYSDLTFEVAEAQSGWKAVHYNYTGLKYFTEDTEFQYSGILNTYYNDYLYRNQYISLDFFLSEGSYIVDSIKLKWIWTYEDGHSVTTYGMNLKSTEKEATNPNSTSFRFGREIEGPKDASADQYPAYVELFMNDISVWGKKLPILDCRPKDAVTLWFISNNGALDFIYCDLVCQRTVNADRTQMTKYATIDDRTQFGKFNYSTEVYESYELNTQIMSDELSKKMKNLFTTNYVWLQDSDGIMHSVVLTEKSLTIKKRQTHKIFNYTIQCEDSQTINLI